MAKPACPPPTMTVSILRMSIFLTLCRSIARRQSLPPRTHTRPSSKANWPLLGLYRREVVGREEFLGGLDRPSNEAPGFSGGAGDSSVVRFEATKYHTVAATDDRPEGRGLSLVFDQILRSSSARRMTRSIAS